MNHQWTILPKPHEDKINELAIAINIRPLLAQLLIQRGIDSFEKAKSFFRSDLEELHNPFLMKDMDKAAQRLSSAIDANEKILIYGDYDVDGTTSVSLMYSFLKHFIQQLEFYIPDRYTEGYGVSKQGIEYAIEHQFSLIITLDCGIRANKMVDFAHEHNIDVIICDHHNPTDKLPNAVAILDPKREDCNYPYKELSGCGVGFKLLQALCLEKNYDETMLYEFLDFVTVSIAADIVPITGENRILAAKGLELLNQNKRPGFKALKQISNFNDELTISNVVFGFAPRINAAGRINHAKDAVKVLISESDEEALQLVETVNNANIERKDLNKIIQEEALELIRNDEFLKTSKTTVLYKEDWHKGIVGIVASRCIEEFYRPTIILTEANGKAVGSARSVRGFSVYDALLECEDLLEQFGGHKYAAGMTIDLKNIEAFKQKFELVVANTITEEQLTPKIHIDLEVQFSDLDMKFYNIITQMAPFGPGNMTPVFRAKGVIDTGGSKIVGETQEHLRLTLKQGSTQMVGIAFGMADKLDIVKSGKPFEICFTLEINEWQGKQSLQLMVRGIKK